jgi:GNAT superfamily N-acetyltransferase
LVPKASDPWSVRTARPSDKKRLASFSCADPAVAWELEVQEYVQRDLFTWAFEPRAAVDDPRLLLLLDKGSGALVAIAAHERAEIGVPGVLSLVATRIEVVAVARSWQGKRFGANTGAAIGPRASDVVMSAVMRDVQTRPRARSNKVFATVHQDNARSLAFCRRYGLVNEMSRPHPEYIRLIN